LGWVFIKNNILEEKGKKAKEIKQEIKGLQKDLEEIQNTCRHQSYSIKFSDEDQRVRRVCDHCGKEIGFASEDELKDNGFM
jgi:hypothetical protein